MTDEKKPFVKRPPRIRPANAAWHPLVDMIEVFPGHRGGNRDGILELFDAPVGIRFEIEEGVKSEILLQAEKEWEGSVSPLCIWQEDGRYNMLYQVNGAQCLAVSDDAFHWTRPDLNEVEYNGSKSNNLIASPCVGATGIFEDSSAPPEERYKAMGGRMYWADPETGVELVSDEAAKRVTAEAEGAGYGGPKAVIHGVMSAWTSADRINWTKLEEPLANRPVNGGICAGWDEVNGRYFAYIQLMGYPSGVIEGVGRSAYEDGMQIRTIGFTFTDDFQNWPAPKLIHHPDAQDDPDISFYGANYFPYPGRDDLHAMLIPIFHQIADTIDGQIAFSRDGLFWSRPERRTNLPVGAIGDGDECVAHFWRSGIVELPDGSWACPYYGNSFLHDAPADTIEEEYPDHPPSQIRWASWRPHRFCGLRADGEGRFSAPSIYRTHDELRLNYSCNPGGWVEVELLEKIPSLTTPDVDPVPGFSFAECDRLKGNAEDQVVSWGGRTDMSAVGEAVGIRFRLFDAKLFAYRV